MLNNIKIFSLLALILTLAGCGFAQGQVFDSAALSTPKNKAKIIVYRNYRVGDKCAPFTLQVDNRTIGTLMCSGFIATTVTPGKHTITLSGDTGYSLINDTVTFNKVVNLSGGSVQCYQLSGSVLNSGMAPGTSFDSAKTITVAGHRVRNFYELVPVSEKQAASQLSQLRAS